MQEHPTHYFSEIIEHIKLAIKTEKKLTGFLKIVIGLSRKLRRKSMNIS